MASPLSIFRKHQLALMVGLVFVAIGSFVVAPSVDKYLGARNRPDKVEDPIVVKWDGGQLREIELDKMRQAHNLAINYLGNVVQQTMQRDGTPRGVSRNMFGQITDPGVPSSSTDENIVYTHLLAQEAEDAGLVVSDETILEFLDQLSDGVIPRGDLRAIFFDAFGNRVNEEFIFDQLRRELLAQKMRSTMQAGLFVAPQGAVIPGKAWHYFRRLNRRVEAEMVPVRVMDLFDQLDGEPAAAELRTIFEAGKDRFRYPDQPEPGFKRRDEAAFQFVRAEFQPFLDIETEKLVGDITDEEIEKHYEDNKQKYTVKPQFDAETSGEVPTAETPSTETPDSETPATGTPTTGTPTTGTPTTGTPTTGTPTTGTPTTGTPTTETPTTGTPGAESPTPEAIDEATRGPANESPAGSDPSTPSDDPAPASSDSPSGAPESGEADSSSQGRVSVTAPYVFVAAQAEENGGQTDSAAEAVPKQPDPAQPTTADEASLSTSTEEAGEGSPASDEASADVPPTSDTAPPAGGEPTGGTVETESATPESATLSDPAVETPPGGPIQPEIRPLDDELRSEIRNEIADLRARPIAQQRLDSALTQVRDQVDEFARELRRRKFRSTESASQVSEELDLASIEHDELLTLEETPFVNALTVKEYELGTSFHTEYTSWPPQRYEFTDIAFQESLTPFTPVQIGGAVSGVTFVFWKTETKEGYVPTFEEARDEVVETWKLQEGLELARARAEELAAEVRQSEDGLEEAVAGDANVEVIQPRPFSWMSTGFNPAGMGEPALSFVEGVEGIGPRFMESVFELKKGEVGLAVNQPKDVVYVVRIVDEMPSTDILRQQFLQSGVTFEVASIADTNNAELRQAWYDDLEDELGVEWQ
jgi:hypothetical protein